MALERRRREKKPKKTAVFLFKLSRLSRHKDKDV